MSPKVRQALYSFGVLLFSGLTILSTLKVVDPNTAATISAAVTSILGVFGVTGFGVAAYNTNKQINNGTLTPAAPEEKVITGIQEVLANHQRAQAAVEKVKDAVSGAIKDVPVLGPLGSQIFDQIIK